MRVPRHTSRSSPLGHRADAIRSLAAHLALASGVVLVVVWTLGSVSREAASALFVAGSAAIVVGLTRSAAPPPLVVAQGACMVGPFLAADAGSPLAATLSLGILGQSLVLFVAHRLGIHLRPRTRPAGSARGGRPASEPEQDR